MPSLPKGKTFDCPSPKKVECLDSWMSWIGEEVEELWTYKKCTEEKYRNKEKQEHNSVKVLLHSHKFSFYYYIQYLGNSTAQTQIQKLLYSREVHNPLSPFKVFFFFSFAFIPSWTPWVFLCSLPHSCCSLNLFQTLLVRSLLYPDCTRTIFYFCFRLRKKLNLNINTSFVLVKC